MKTIYAVLRFEYPEASSVRYFTNANMILEDLFLTEDYNEAIELFNELPKDSSRMIEADNLDELRNKIADLERHFAHPEFY